MNFSLRVNVLHVIQVCELLWYRFHIRVPSNQAFIELNSLLIFKIQNSCSRIYSNHRARQYIYLSPLEEIRLYEKLFIRRERPYGSSKLFLILKVSEFILRNANNSSSEWRSQSFHGRYSSFSISHNNKNSGICSNLFENRSSLESRNMFRHNYLKFFISNLSFERRNWLKCRAFVNITSCYIISWSTFRAVHFLTKEYTVSSNICVTIRAKASCNKILSIEFIDN